MRILGRLAELLARDQAVALQGGEEVEQLRVVEARVEEDQGGAAPGVAAT
ncbi:MAG: hypothetical protein HY812_14945 [Planctomycetes bacterium]|nr:hypothetical protein [Planctomycetota bacterium]